MNSRKVQGTESLARQIRIRRNALGMTIVEAASRAGVGTKTWYRYESGASIRSDKVKGICKALNWKGLPFEESDEREKKSLKAYRTHEAWSKYLEENFGVGAAVLFAAGSDILFDQINDDISAISKMPAGSHIGQLEVSWLAEKLPPQFLMCYDYDFLYKMQCTLKLLRRRAITGMPMIAQSVMEELVLYICNEEGVMFNELTGEADDVCDDEDVFDLEGWIFDLFGDMDIITYLYSDMYVTSDDKYHFLHWEDKQFYTK